MDSLGQSKFKCPFTIQANFSTPQTSYHCRECHDAHRSSNATEQHQTVPPQKPSPYVADHCITGHPHKQQTNFQMRKALVLSGKTYGHNYKKLNGYPYPSCEHYLPNPKVPGADAKCLNEMNQIHQKHGKSDSLGRDLEESTIVRRPLTCAIDSKSAELS